MIASFPGTRAYISLDWQVNVSWVSSRDGVCQSSQRQRSVGSLPIGVPPPGCYCYCCWNIESIDAYGSDRPPGVD